MSKLYILNNNKGLVKIGITDDKVENRIKKINSDLFIDDLFTEISSFNVDKHVAKIESIIHDFFNQKFLNISYLKEKANIIEFDTILTNKTEGYTEMFLSNPSLIKNIFFFLGYLGLIDFNENDIDKFNHIQSFDFEYFYKKYPEKILNLAIQDTSKSIKIQENLKEDDILNKINQIHQEENLVISLSDNGELFIKNDKLLISNIEFTSLSDHNLKIILRNKPLNIGNDKTIINSLVNKFLTQNKDIRTQSSLSLRKEIKEEKLADFFSYEKRNLIKEIMDINSDNGDFYFPDELLFNDYVLIKDKFQKQNKQYNNKNNLMKPNLRAKLGEDVFKKYINAMDTNQYSFLNDSDDNTKDNVKALGHIFKYLYDNDNKEQCFDKTLSLIKVLYDYATLALWENPVNVIFNKNYHCFNRETAIKHTLHDLINIVENDIQLKDFTIDYLFAMDNQKMHEHQHTIKKILNSNSNLSKKM